MGGWEGVLYIFCNFFRRLPCTYFRYGFQLLDEATSFWGDGCKTDSLATPVQYALIGWLMISALERRVDDGY